jgi:hypothetical protein
MKMHFKTRPRMKLPDEYQPSQRDFIRQCSRLLWLGVWLMLAWPIIVGCSSNEPAIAKANVKLIEKLRAAVTAKNADWLATTAKQMQLARQQRKLSDEENAALEPIVADARLGQWDAANTRLQALINAQHGR